MTTPTLFAERDPDEVLAEALAIYEAETGVALAAADPRRLHLQALLQFIAQQRVLINFAGLQSLPAYVSEVWINDLATWLGAAPLPAQPATTTLRLTFSIAGPHLIAAGKRATGGGFLWSMPQVAVPVGASSVDVLGTCTTLGDEPNDLAPGEIDEMADPIPYLASVVNVTRTDSGVAAETTEAFRSRLQTAPDGWATAGPRDAYVALARAVSPAILDVAAVAKRDNADLAGGPVADGVVRVLVLVLGGASVELLAAVTAALSAETVQPFVDALDVTTPQDEGTAVDLVIAGTYYIAQSRSGEATAIQTAVDAAFEAYLLWQTSEFGRDVNPDELRRLVLNAGAKRLTLGAFAFAALAPDEVAVIPAAVVDLTKYVTAVGDGVVTVVENATTQPAPGDYWLICSSAAVGPVAAVFQVFRATPPNPPLVAEVEADGVLATVLGLDITLTEGATQFAVFDLYTFTVQATPTLVYGGLEDD